MSFWRAVLIAGVTATVSLALGLGLSLAAEDRGSNSIAPAIVYQGSKAPEDKRATEHRLACTHLNEAPNFTAYSLGPEFEGLPLTTVIRRCDAPYPGESVRANYVDYIYGECKFTGGDEQGCTGSLVTVQTWPACERSSADYEIKPGVAYPRTELGQIRGVPAESFDGGSRLELYTGASTVVIFGVHEKELRPTVVEALRPEPTDRPPGTPADSDAGDSTVAELPEPVPGALQGQASCLG